ncbi:hypothetical protein H6503_02765 [Candidatus Woesearchaeota archaeon]|nr:hypothetical protein [Candidatus Woesearchaeota archaeon]
MAIVGFNFTKISAEKKSAVKGKININNNVMFTDAKEVDISLGAKDNKGLLIKFLYTCEYEPKIGKIEIEGDLVTVEDAAKIKECIASWKKSKSMDMDLSEKIMAHVLNKATIQSIILSRDLNLPAPVPLPKVQKGKK